MEHLHVSEKLAAGLRSLPDAKSSFASTQAAWRFYRNERTCVATLAQPLLMEAHKGVAERCDKYALCVHDWSMANFGKHQSKLDRKQRTHKNDIGYELQTALLLNDRYGEPLAPIVQNVVTDEGVWSSYHDERIKLQPHLEELTSRMAWIANQGFAHQVVHIIDREAASVQHQRQWDEANHLFVLRDKVGSKVEFNGREVKLGEVADSLTFQITHEVEIKGKKAMQYVGEAEVTMTRPAKPKRCDAEGKRVKPIKGKPLRVRMVVSRILDNEGHVLAEWVLLSNVWDVEAKTIALWYYWRWRIESFFKLLKQAGHQLESWQQESGLALAKRLLIASMACVVVWQVVHSELPAAKEIQSFLVKLSGRQMKRSKPVTWSALLAGFWSLLSMLEVIENYSVDELHQFRSLLRKTSSAFAKLVPE
jgi:hypothetical protein